MKRAQEETQLVGFSVGSLEMLRFLYGLGVVNFMELRIERMRKTGTPILEFEDGIFKANHKSLEALTREFPGLRMSFHPAVERTVSMEKEYGLCAALEEHWPIFLQRAAVLEEIYADHGVGEKYPFHPPFYRYKTRFSLGEDECLRRTNLLMRKLDAIFLENGYRTKMCLENMLMPKKDFGAVGSKSEHFDRILGGTSVIGTMLDTGHANLSEGFRSVEHARRFGCSHIHLHGNGGIAKFSSISDDEHLPATPENLKEYRGIIDFIREARPSVIFELGDLSLYSEQEFVRMIEKFKQEVVAK